MYSLSAKHPNSRPILCCPIKTSYSYHLAVHHNNSPINRLTSFISTGNVSTTHCATPKRDKNP